MTEIDNEELFYWIIMFSFVVMMWITVLWAWL